MQWTRLADPGAVARRACETILETARAAIGARGGFRIVLAGGGTPKRTYELLAGTQSDWARWHVYFGDERCLPADNPARNSRMAAGALTDRVPIPPGQVHPIPAEQGAEAAARRYTGIIRAGLPFDLVLLGLGEDGHTASLFPGHGYPETAAAIPVHGAPKPPPDRVSLTPAALSDCRRLLFLVTGEGKREAVARWRRGDPLPAAAIHPAGEGEVLADRHAWPDPP